MQRPNPETTTLADILITEELSLRVPRAPNWQAEAEAMRSLAQQMARDSQSLMQILADTALELCQAGTAGVSLLETTPDGEEIFRWNVLAGTLAHHVGETTPCNFSPCGVCLEQGSPVLFSHPERYFSYFQEASSPIVEGLVLPLVADSHVLGTIWIMSHDEQRHFDCEDVRVMTSLADFTATALLLQQRQTGELLAANAALEAEIAERKQAEERIQALISNLPGGAVFVVDRDLRYLLAEGEALAIAGFKPEDFVGRTIFEMLPPELAASYEPMYRKALTGEPFEDEHNAHNHTYISRGTPLRAENGEIYAVLVVSYDITERKRAEDERKQVESALRESEAFRRLAVESGRMGTWRWDCRSRQCWGDAGFLSLWGVPPSDEKLPVSVFTSRLSPEGVAALEAVMTKDIAPGEEFDWQLEVVAGANAGCWIRWRGQAERETPWIINGVSFDVTQQKRAEVALRESEAKYRTLFNAIEEGFCSIEVLYDESGQPVDHRILEANPAFERHTGLTDVQGRLASELMPGVEQFWNDLYARVVATGEFERLEQYSSAFDRWFDVEISRIGDESLHRVAVVFQDITDRKQAEAALRESEARFRAFVTASSNMVYRMSADWHQMRNLEGKEILANTEAPSQTWIDTYIPTAEQSRVWAAIKAAIRTKSPFELEHQVIQQDGTIGWVFSRAIPMLDDQGDIIEWFGAGSDITARKQTEAALRESEEKYRSLFDSVDEGYLLSEVIFDENDQPIDILYLEANPAAVRLAGRDFSGRRMREIDPNYEEYWYEIYGYVALTGESVRAERYAEPHGRWFDFYAFKVGGQESRRVAAVFNDITDRKRREAHLAFLAELAEDFSRLSSAAEIMRAVGTKVGTYLNISTCLFAEINEGQDQTSVQYPWHTPDTPDLTGVYRLSDFFTEEFRQAARSGETIVIRDTQADPRTNGDQYAALKMHAFVSVPFHREGEWKYMFSVTDSVARDWREDEIELIREMTNRTFPRLERARAETAMRESEAKYRSLFNSLDEAFAVVEVIANDSGEWNDFLFLEVNPAFVKQTGMEYPVGRKATELLGTPNPQWAQVYGRVAETGEPIRFEQGEATLGRVFDLYVFRLGGEGSRCVAVLFTDITERKRAEETLRESEEQQAFLLKFSDTLRAEPDADAVANRAIRMLSEQMQLDRCYIGVYRLADDRGDFTHQVGNDRVPPLPDGVRLSDFPEALRVAFDRTLVINDVAEIEGLMDMDRQNLSALGLRALVAATLRKGENNPLWSIVSVSAHPRCWTRGEIALVEEVTERTWAAMERARAEASLRNSEAKYRSLFDSIDAGFCIFEMVYNEAGEAIDFRYIETNPAFERQSGRRPQSGQTMRELFPEAEDMWLKDYAEVARTGQAKRFIDFHQELDRWFDVFVFPSSNGKNQLAALFSDVTEEKRSESALRESEKRLQKAISIETVGVLFFTLDGQITDANDTFLRMSGYSRDELRTITHWQELIPPEFWDVTGVAALELATLGTTAPYEKQHLRKDGSRWWGLFSPTRLKGSGRNAECVEFVIDITDRKRAKAQLSRVAQMDAFRIKLADALRPLSDPVQIQAEACRLLGEQLGVDRAYYVEVHEPEGYARVNQHYSRGDSPSIVGNYQLSEYGWSLPIMRRGETIVITDTQSTNIIPDAERAAMATIGMVGFVALPLIKGEVLVGALAVNEPAPREWTEAEVELVRETAERIWADIQRAHAETALRQSEEKYRSLFESIDEGFNLLEMISDESGHPSDFRIVETNPAWEQQTGLTDAIGKTLLEIPPSFEQQWLDFYSDVVISGRGRRIEYYTASLDRWYTVYASRIGGEGSRQVAVVFNDISDRKQAEAERLQLIREQAAREQERQRAESLAELDRAKTAFFSNVSHEFRTPLTLSLAPLQDALSDRTHPLDPVQRERLELVHRNSLRLLKLVNTLLDFSRIEAGRMEAVYEPTDLATYTTELSSVFRSAIERAGLQLIVDCPPLPEPVFVDRQMWEKIVLNLLSNAFKFTFEGEIRVSLHSTDSNQAVLQIQDTGTGIAPEHLPHLFERFYQVRGTQARTHDGSGIGLTLVHELVRLQGGTIEVSSTVGEGTCFTIALTFETDHLPSDRLHFEGDRQPTRTLASTAMGAAAYVEKAERWLPEESKGSEEVTTNNSLSPPASPSPPAHILIVDDNADIREYLTRILNEHVQVEAVADGVTALAAVQERVPDLILSDVMMPGLDGFELLEALRADPRTREIPIILLSARAGEEAIVVGLEAGADDYLIKPFSAQELISRVTAHLQMAHLRGEALQEARSTIQSRDEFISIVSHELNTPLVSILGWTRLLRANSPSPTMLTKALDTIERNATLQAKLVQDLLDISRITAGKLRLNTEPVELEAVIETAMATVTQMAQTKGIDLNWKKNMAHQDAPNDNSIVVMGDRDRLGQVICNLLSNAIKFTPQSGSVTIELSVIDDDHSPNISYARICVTDTGIGIAADFLPHVFERFRQARDSDAAKGMGLGLAIARHLVELHNGTISAQSAGVGQGATFTVKLPLCLSQ